MNLEKRVALRSAVFVSLALLLLVLLQPVSADFVCDDPDDPDYDSYQCEGGCCCFVDEATGTESGIYLNERWLCDEDYGEAVTRFEQNIDPAANCPAICTEGDLYQLFGYVTDADGNPQEGVTVSISGYPGAITDLQGYYRIQDIRAGTYAIRATPSITSGCVAVEDTVEVEDNTRKDLSIACTCIPDWECDAVSECVDGIQEYSCVDENGCDTMVGMPPLLRICSEQQPEFCSDPDDLSHGEECYSEGSTNIQGVCPTAEACIPKGQPGECYCRTSLDDCGDGTCNQATGECATCPDDCGTAHVDGDPVCTEACEAQPVGDLLLTPIPLDDAMRVEWVVQDPSCIARYELQRCEGPNSDCVSFQEIDFSEDSFTDEGLEPNTPYCYTLTYEFKNPLAPPKTGGQMCIDTGDAYCMYGYGTEEAFCRESSIQRCAENNSLTIVDECEDSACIMQDGAPICSDAGPCELCNGLYGVFASPDNLVMYEDQLQHCAYFISRNSICYEDTQLTATDAYDYCGQILDCNDYASEEACEDDTCDMFSALGGCEWSYLSDELGIGVCRPKDDGLQDCSLCEDHPLLDACSPELCGLYGNCYYHPGGNQLQTEAACLGADTLGCRLYDTQEACEGGSSALVDVTWGEPGLDPDKQTGGTHAFLSQSDDLLSIGTCVWDETVGCYKDTNNFVGGSPPSDDCTEPHSDTDVWPYNFRVVANVTECIRDNEAPATVLYDTPSNTYGPGEYFDLDFRVEDNVYSSEDILTHFCYPEAIDVIGRRRLPAALGVDGCYPDQNLTQLQNNLAYEKFDNEEMTFDLVYYSQDVAKNLEFPQAKTITIDAKPPAIALDYDMDAYFIAENKQVSDLEVLATTDELAYCNVSLVSGAGTGEIVYGSIFSYGQSFTTTYYKLASDVYHLVAVCTDDYGNQAEKVEQIYADGDSSIRNPLPTGTVNVSTADISVETGDDAIECRYSDATLSYGNMQEQFISANSTLWTDTVSDLDSGLYRYYTACAFDDGSITEKNPADTIVFAVDTEPPVTTVMDADQNIPYTQSTAFKEEIRLGFLCEDPLILNGPVHYEYGHESCETLVCISDMARSPGTCTGWRTVTGPLEIDFIDAQNSEHIAYVHFYSIDAGGNEERPRTAEIKLKDLRKPKVFISIN